MNRGFLYGDGFFETIKVVKGTPVFWQIHWERVVQTLDYLSLELKVSQSEFVSLIDHFLKSCDTGRLRITFYRKGEGAYFPNSNEAAFEFTYKELKESIFELNEPIPVSLSSVQLPKHEQGNYKLIQKTQQIRAAIEAKTLNENEAIMLNNEGELCEAISSNIFVLKDGGILTPPLSSGCLNGTVRKQLLESYPNAKEVDLNEMDLVKADAIFITNSIKGIQPVFLVESSTHNFEPLVKWLNEKCSIPFRIFREFCHNRIFFPHRF